MGIEYKSIKQINLENKRVYETPDGNKLPSVTTILAACKSEESKAALDAWREREGADVADKITRYAANVGTHMHSTLEYWCAMREMPAATGNFAKQLAWKMAKNIVDSALQENLGEVYGCEVGVYFPSLYAGNTDLVAVYKNKLCVLDFKQTLQPKQEAWIDDYKEQLVAYIDAHNEVYNTSIDTGVVLMSSQALHFQDWEVTGADLDAARHRWWKKVEQYYALGFDK